VSVPERCADLSELAGEPLGATATTAENWLLVEVPGTWERDVADGAGLSDRSRGAARAWLAETESSRLLFLRRPGRARSTSKLVHLVRASEQDAGVRRFELGAHDELADLDLAGGGERVERQLVLVCGHGARDACCALRGTAVYTALSRQIGDCELWLSSHQGGHRFAANVLVLPAGLQLGRLTPENAGGVVREALSGRIDLDHYRGRSAYPARAQAAELAVRAAAGLVAVSDLELVDAGAEPVRFLDRDGRERAAVVEERAGPTLPASCGAEPEPQRTLVARVV